MSEPTGDLVWGGEVTFSSESGKSWEQKALAYYREWEALHQHPADVFDFMTSRGYKLNLLTGEYYRE